MKTYDVLVVGGGMVADAAAQALREQGHDGSIGILGEEPVPPFPRPALSKKLWTDPDFTQDGLDPRTAEQTGAEIHLATRVTSVDPQARTVTTADGTELGYGSLLVATGGRPRGVDGLPASDRVLHYRTLTDYQRLRALAGGGARVAVVGGGYIGSEIAAALSQQDCEVTVVHPEQVLGDTRFPEPLAQRFQQLFVDAGVRLLSGTSVDGGEQRGDEVSLRLSDGGVLDVDVVVVGMGIEPAGDVLDGVAERSEDGGIVVDERLRTTAEGVFAAGDVAQYPDRILGRRRVEHVDNASAMGAAVGRIIAGSDETYDHTPMFYSDVLGHGFEAMGSTSTDLETVVDERADGRTVVYYLTDDEVAGVLVWDGDGDELEGAEQLLAAHTRPANPVDLLGRL